jgi:hypothetical protein
MGKLKGTSEVQERVDQPLIQQAQLDSGRL